MTRIMDHRPKKIAKGPQKKQAGPKEPRERSGKVMSIMKNGKQARMGQMSPEKEVVKSWALWEMESKQEWAKGAQRKELSN